MSPFIQPSPGPDDCPSSVRYPPEHRFSWGDLMSIHRSRTYHVLGRRPEQLASYHDWTQQCRQTYQTVGDFIRHKILGFPVDWTTDGSLQLKRVLYTPPISAAMRQKRLILRLNDFPYSFTDDLLHYCLWSDSEWTSEEIERYLRLSFWLHDIDVPLESNGLIWFMNSVERKSIRDVWHIHVIVKRS